jgi:hypothetical protein
MDIFKAELTLAVKEQTWVLFEKTLKFMAIPLKSCALAKSGKCPEICVLLLLCVTVTKEGSDWLGTILIAAGLLVLVKKVTLGSLPLSAKAVAHKAVKASKPIKRLDIARPHKLVKQQKCTYFNLQ